MLQCFSLLITVQPCRLTKPGGSCIFVFAASCADLCRASISSFCFCISDLVFYPSCQPCWCYFVVLSDIISPKNRIFSSVTKTFTRPPVTFIIEESLEMIQQKRFDCSTDENVRWHIIFSVQYALPAVPNPRSAIYYPHVSINSFFRNYLCSTIRVRNFTTFAF
ncbi:hypothetical protein HBA_0845 [Sodalis endosymbiont of Henestaris halophilus]|nr:hypothetical protein HBA_0845 [Sodalis endosymbiont of Henestaris halophilus]